MSSRNYFLSHILFAALFTPSLSVSAEAEQPYIRGVVQAIEEAVITTEFPAQVDKIPLRIGDSFQRGDTLIRFNCDELMARKEASKAAHTAASLQHQNNLELKAHGAIGQLEVEVSQAQSREAKAMYESIRARTRNCVIRAPFNGRVADLSINAFEIPAANTPLMKIVGSDQLELRLIIPSNWLNWVQPGTPFHFTVDETEQSYPVSVTGIGAEVDPVSRTIQITAQFIKTPGLVLPGMSGTAYFKANSSETLLSEITN